MRVEAIVKKDGLFIPSPGFDVGKRKHILLDISPVLSSDTSDSFIQAAGILKKKAIDGVVFQKKLRNEWGER